MRLYMITPALLMLVLLVVACSTEQGRQAEQAAPAQQAEETVRTPAEEAAALDRGPRAREVLVSDPARAERGASLADAKGCLDCHVLGEADLAPDLLTALDKRTLPWLQRQITDPEWMLQHDPVTQQLYEEYGLEMVDMDVSGSEAVDILHYLLREAEAAAP